MCGECMPLVTLRYDGCLCEICGISYVESMLIEREREREGERERESDHETERPRDRETERQRDRETKTESARVDASVGCRIAEEVNEAGRGACC